MIGCIGYTDVTSCYQFINDIQQTKFLYFMILAIVVGYLIYYSRTAKYKALVKKYHTYRIMTIVPIYLSYLFIPISIVYSPLLLSIQTSLESFMYFVYAFVWPSVTWSLLMLFVWGLDLLFQKLGFSDSRDFFKSAWKWR